MIVNVISGQSSGYTNPNPFPGMSLAEACGMLQAYTSDAINEMNMSILLNEHAYLLENGTEIEYVNEANYQLKEKIKTAIDKVTKSVSDLWDKLVKWVQDRVEDVREKFARLSVNKKKCQDIIKNWKDGSEFTCKISKYVDIKALEAGADMLADTGSEIKGFNTSDFAKASDDNDTFEYANNKIDTIKKAFKEKEVPINKQSLQDAFDVVFETDRSVLNKIRKGKAAAIKGLNDLKKQIKEEKDDDKSDKLKTANMCMRLISKLSSELVKAYHLYISNNVEILHFVNRNKSINKDIDKTNLDNDKKLKDALKAKADAEGTTLSNAKQRYADGDAAYSRAALKRDGYLKESSSIFSGDRFFPVY